MTRPARYSLDGRKYPVRATHVWQDIRVFAVPGSQSGYCASSKRVPVFLDGDTVPIHDLFPITGVGAACGIYPGTSGADRQRAAAWFGLHQFNADRRRGFGKANPGMKHCLPLAPSVAADSPDLRGSAAVTWDWREHLIEVNGYNEALLAGAEKIPSWRSA